MIPNPTNYPESLDDDNNLFLVHDSLRVRLIEDYKPGDKEIFIEGDEEIISRFPPTGIITLTEQCSEIDKRAISLYYGSRTQNSFGDLEKLPEFGDFIKPKKITNVTMNVLDKHHNHLKDTLISIQTFLGTKEQQDARPLGETISGRINFLKNIVYQPKAWFNMSNTKGLIPLKVSLKEDGFRKGYGEVSYIWQIKKNEESDWETINLDEDDEGFYYIFNAPGLYDIRLTIKNDYGEDTAVFYKSINAKIEAPKEAKSTIEIIPKITQNYIEGDSLTGRPPKIRSTTNTFIEIKIEQGVNASDPNYSNAGELLDEGGDPIDPIVEYTWDLGDELSHDNSNYTRASYSIGGYYDITLRVDTKFGSYRITKYENSIDIIENQNLWLFNLQTINSVSGGILEAWEFGLVSETFKLLGNRTLFIDRNDSFLDIYDDSNYTSSTKSRAKKEFFRNVEFAKQGTLSSGEGGNSLLLWASGGDVLEDQEIKVRKYNAFEDTYSSLNSINNKPWNWASLVSQDKIYFILGQYGETSANSNFANPEKTDYDLISYSVFSERLGVSNFENGAEELLNHPSNFNSDGIPTNGYFAVYKTTWKDSTGYILRNSSVNDFFRISDFYKTNGNFSNVFSTIAKLPDMSGSTKTEGEIVSLSSGVFFFNNSGEISAWNDSSLTWETGRVSALSSFRSFQDSNQTNFDNKSNSLLAVSDEVNTAYLSYDYSLKTFIKFNLIDLTFSTAGTGIRPAGNQLKLGIY